MTNQRENAHGQPSTAQAPWPIVLTIKQAAAALNVSYQTCSRLIARGDLPTVRWGGVVRVPTIAVSELVARTLEGDGLSALAAKLRAEQARQG